jgi:hypothetical protein
MNLALTLGKSPVLRVGQKIIETVHRKLSLATCCQNRAPVLAPERAEPPYSTAFAVELHVSKRPGDARFGFVPRSSADCHPTVMRRWQDIYTLSAWVATRVGYTPDTCSIIRRRRWIH